MSSKLIRFATILSGTAFLVLSSNSTQASGPVGATPGIDTITVAHPRALQRVADARAFIAGLTPVRTYVVTSTADLPDADTSDALHSPPTLRAAIENANKNSDFDLIVFDLNNATINITSQLTTVSQPCMIDGAGSGIDPVIIDGTGAGFVPGLWLNAGGCVVRNLEIRNFGGSGLQLGSTLGPRDMIVQNVRSHHNRGAGINVNRMKNALVGGTAAGESNRLYSNWGSGGKGISLTGSFGIRNDSNVVIGNWMGTDNGADSAGNTREGVFVETGVGNIISNNIIIANEYGGITMGDEDIDPSQGNVIEYNLIGIGSDGVTPFPNGETNGAGIYQRFSRADTIRCNVISGNTNTEAINHEPETRHMVIRDNLIGTSPDTTTGVGNGFEAILIFGDSNFVLNNICSNANRGVSIRSSGEFNTIQGNWCGRHERFLNLNANESGIFVQGRNNLIGGPNPADANVLGWNGTGVFLFGSACSLNVVSGNTFGLNRAQTDTTGMDNACGIAIQGTATHNQIIDNVICYTTIFSGIDIYNLGTQLPSDNVIQGNYIGVSPVGMTPFGNRKGIWFDSSGAHVVGGDNIGAANTIRYNVEDGVFIEKASGIQVQNNFIANNGQAGVNVVSGFDHTIRFNFLGGNGALGIDLNNDGVTPNDSIGDPDTGPNMLQNFPVIDSIRDNGTTIVYGSLRSNADQQYVLDFYASETCDPTTYGEGELWRDSLTVTTDVIGVAEFAHDITGALTGGNDWLTMTATDLLFGSTSEFCMCDTIADSTIPPPPPDSADIVVFKDTPQDTVSLGDSVFYTLLIWNDGPDTDANVVAVDTIPAGLAYLEHSDQFGNCVFTGGALICTFLDMAPGDTAKVDLAVSAVTQGDVVNYLSAAGTLPDSNLFNNRDSMLITVTCPIAVTGDAQGSGDVNSTDIIYLVNYVLKAGPEPSPCEASGDANCDGVVNSTDIIYLVNFVLKAGPAPCDVCSLIPGTWTCP